MVRTNSLYEGALARARASDGGFGPRAGLSSEPEPTALAAIALEDDGARAWLEAHQRNDGHLVMSLGDVENDASTALAAIALEGGSRERALDAVVSTRAAYFQSTGAVPFDDTFRGWPWTLDAFGWTEPTARALLAMRLLRPGAADAIGDGLSMLRDRECVGGGWNYGNRIVLGEDLPPYTQTTAMAMLALQNVEDLELRSRGIERLKRLWRAEAEGGLSLALAAAALRAHDDSDHVAAAARVAENFDRTGFLGDVVALAWAAIATGRGLERMVVSR